MDENIFDLQFSTASELDTSLTSDSELGADLSTDEEFAATLEETTQVFSASMEENTEVIDADLGVDQTVHTAPVTSVNGMVGDVEIHIPEYVSELENDSGYITETGMDYLTNMEIETLLT